MEMKINIDEHFFRYYAGKSEVSKLNGFSVGEIVVDWYGDTGCILTINKDGDVRLDSNGMGPINKIKKLRSKRKIADYLCRLHRYDIQVAINTHQRELDSLKRLR